MKKLFLVFVLSLPLIWIGCEHTFINVESSAQIIKEYSFAAPQIQGDDNTNKANVLDIKVFDDGSVKVYRSERTKVETDQLSFTNLSANKIVGNQIKVSEENTWFIPFNEPHVEKLEVSLNKANTPKFKIICSCEADELPGSCLFTNVGKGTFTCKGTCGDKCKTYVLVSDGTGSRTVPGGVLIQATALQLMN